MGRIPLVRGLCFACALTGFQPAIAAVGTTAGSFDVTPDGAAAYTIPISVPPGTAGMEPKLSLRYSSHGDNGLIGVGWSLRGLSRIARCPATHAQDGFTDAVDYDDNDKLCLDGARLVAVSGDYGQSGTEYRTEVEQFIKVRQSGGPINSDNVRFTVWTKNGLIQEHGFRNNSAFGVPGQTYDHLWSVDRVSDTAGNYIEITYATDPAGKEHYVDRIDYTGNNQVGLSPYNSVRFEYDTNRPDKSSRYMASGSDAIRSVLRLKAVKTYVQLTPAREYRLTYETSSTSDRSLLVSVEECAHTSTAHECLPATEFAWTEASSGFTDYIDLNPPFDLIGNNKAQHGEAIDINGDGLTDFIKAYGNNMETWLNDDANSYQSWYRSIAHALPEPLFKDNGQLLRELEDMNGDGLPDLVESQYSTSLKVYINENGSWQADPSYQMPRPIHEEIPHSTLRTRQVGQIADINGDGLPDLVFFGGDGGEPETYLNIGSSCSTVGCNWQSTPAYDLPDLSPGTINNTDRQRGLRDINGDGLPDYMLARYKYDFTFMANIASGNQPEYTFVKTYINTGAGWQEAPEYNLPAPLKTKWIDEYKGNFGGNHTRLVDVNGDGLDDVVCAIVDKDFFYGIEYVEGLEEIDSDIWDIDFTLEEYPCGLDSAVNETTGFIRATYINTGYGFQYDPTYNLLEELVPPNYSVRTSLFQDVNNDGKGDFILSGYAVSNNTYLNQYASDCTTEGCKWQAEADYTLPFDFFYGNTEASNGAWGAVGQFDLDGRSDFVTASHNDTADAIYISNGVGANQPPLDLIRTISPGAQRASIDIEYTTLLDSGHYTPGNSAYPNSSTAGGYQVVAQSTHDSGTSGSVTVRYEYEDLRANALGRGMLGFRIFRAENLDTGVIESTEYAQEFPYTGMVVSTTTVGPGFFDLSLGDLVAVPGQLLTKTINTLAAEEFGSGSAVRYFPYVATSDEQFFDPNDFVQNEPLTTTRTETTYDNFGNATQVVQKQFQGASPGADTHTSVTTSQYTNDPSQWLLGRLTHSTVTKTNPAGASVTRETAFEYDAVTGLLTAEITEPNDPGLLHRTDYTYDSFGNHVTAIVSGADIESRTTTTTWDSRGQFKAAVTNSLGHTETHDYSEQHGGRTSLTGPNGQTTTWDYDAFGRQIGRTTPDGTTVTTSYEDCGMACPVSNGVFAIRKTGSDGSESVEVFDRLERKVLEAARGYDGSWIDVVFEYDHRDRVIAQTAPHYRGEGQHWATTEYDSHNRVLRTETPANDSSSGGIVTQIVYDGLIVREIDAQGRVTEKHKNATGRTIKVVDALGGTTQCKYDPYGNIIQVTDAAGNVTTLTYDRLGRKIAMSDPDMGDWTYSYDVLGNLVSQTDARNQTVTMVYDKLGRMLERNEPEGTTTWGYDTDWVGSLDKEIAPDGFERSYVYDGLGRVTDTITLIDGQTYTVSRTYDGQSRLKKLTYPSGFAVRHNYTASGYLNEIVDDASNDAYWQLDHRDAFGNVELETLGNGQSTVRNYDDARGHVDAIMTGSGFGTEVQSLTYEWDKLGNLTARVDQNQNGLREEFEYDDLYRLTGSTLNDTSNLSVTYDPVGNITSKSGVGSYSYGAGNAGPHAATQITGNRAATYSYDANGNMLQGAGRTLSWTSFNKPATITKGQAYSEFLYGPDRARYKHIREREENGQLTNTVIHYVGTLYERHHEGLGFEDKHYIRVDGEGIAIQIHHSNGSEATHYLHRDHLGSITAITDANGNIVERYAYDAFGKRRGLAWDNNGNDSLLYLTIQVFDRGYTDHEHLDHVGLIHMNGRVYDPIIGRFASADPTVQFPESTQGFNRYTYVHNNPLSYTDPSGYGLWSSIKKAFKKLVKAHVKVAEYVTGYRVAERYPQATAMAITIVAPQLGLGFWGAVGTGFAAGMVGSGGDIKAGLIGGLTAGAFQQVGQGLLGKGVLSGLKATGFAGKVISHGIVGGVSSDLQGGKFKSGFLSAGFAKAATVGLDSAGYFDRVGAAGGGVTVAVVGGTAAELGGGKFSNGAMTSAFGFAFNQCMSTGCGGFFGMSTADLEGMAMQQQADDLVREAERQANDLLMSFEGRQTVMHGGAVALGTGSLFTLPDPAISIPLGLGASTLSFGALVDAAIAGQASVTDFVIFGLTAPIPSSRIVSPSARNALRATQTTVGAGASARNANQNAQRLLRNPNDSNRCLPVCD